MAMRWYVTHVYSGSEQKVAQAIREQAAQRGLDELISDVLVPVEEVVEVRRGAKVQAERKFFPGYVLVRMELTDETWVLIKNTPKV
ncbi:MAG: transcription termination/antitermination NusG family protein, partial [Rhodospirillales bacterium]